MQPQQAAETPTVPQWWYLHILLIKINKLGCPFDSGRENWTCTQAGACSKKGWHCGKEKGEYYEGREKCMDWIEYGIEENKRS